MGLEEVGSTQGVPTAAAPPPLRRVVTGADAFGSDLKDSLKEYLKERNIEVVDLGVDKYYSIAVKVASHLAKEKKASSTSSPEEPLSRGLLVCGTGIGVSIFANKFGGVYAAPCNSVAEAVNARSINNTNVLTLGSMISSPEEGKKILEAWLETPFKAPCPASNGCAWNVEIDRFLDDSIQEMERISQAALENGVVSAAEGEDGGRDKSTSTKDIGEEGEHIVHDKSTCTADIGVEKISKPMQSPMELLQEILASSTLSSATAVDDDNTLGLSSEERAGNGPGLTRVHATVSTTYEEGRAGVGPGLMAIHAPISQPSIISMEDVTASESPTTELLVKNEELQGNSEDNKKRPDEVNDDQPKPKQVNGCAICALASKREFENVDIMPGGSWRILREDPTSAVVRFKAGSLEPAHHHTFGHDLIVTYGKKTVWNLSTEERFDLTTGDFLYTPAGEVHRVQYHEDTEFFIRWDGHWDILLDEDIDTAKDALNKAGSLTS